MTRSLRSVFIILCAAALTACASSSSGGGGGGGGGGSGSGGGSAGTVDDFYDALAQRESGGNAAVENSFGYLGLYQMGELAMMDANWYGETAPAETSSNDWIGSWLTEAQSNGVSSKPAYLANAPAQDVAVFKYHDRVWTYIVALDLDDFEGSSINGIAITRSGLLAASHLLGAGTLRDYLESGGSGTYADGYGTSIEEYLSLFANYETRYSTF